MRATNRKGRIIVIGFASGDVPPIPANIILVKNIDVLGFYWGGYLKFRPDLVMKSIRELMDMHAAGKLHPHISHTLSLDQAADALDLLVVCVEAGVSLDASMLRVSKDLSGLHRELCYELAQVVRRIGAGIPRDRALQQLPVRTGVEELRTLVASMIQSERLGSSISRVLRINAETLRLRRRQGAEKKAAEAALKMMFPIALFQLPALLIIVVGPTVVELIRQIKGNR